MKCKKLRKEFNINEVEFIVIQAIKGNIKIEYTPQIFQSLDRNIRKFVKLYHKRLVRK